MRSQQPEVKSQQSSSQLMNEKGIALVMVLLLSAITLVIMAGLIYMITTGTQISGMQKRYKTASEAAMGGTDITYQLAGLRGDTSRTASFLSDLSALAPAITTPATCTGTNLSGTSFTGLAAKLNTPTTSWAGCDNTMVINPNTGTSYDMVFTLGTVPTYNVYSKIVDTVEGNSAGDEGLINNRVVDSNSGEIRVMSYPYLYTIEVDAENAANPSERAKFSVLYLY
ncbi:MAG: hypothetical protein V1832_02660 [Nitrospirota bacterium]